VVFHSLTREDLRRIVDLLLANVQGRLVEQGIALEVTDEAKAFLITEGYDEEYGARPLRRAIQSHVDDALADAILAGEVASGATARLVMEDGAIRVLPVAPFAVAA